MSVLKVLTGPPASATRAANAEAVSPRLPPTVLNIRSPG